LCVIVSYCRDQGSPENAATVLKALRVQEHQPVPAALKGKNQESPNQKREEQREVHQQKAVVVILVAQKEPRKDIRKLRRVKKRKGRIKRPEERKTNQGRKKRNPN